MNNYNFWLSKKSANYVTLISSWCFYRTFDEDAKYLSTYYGFRIKSCKNFLQVWFPKSSLDKYLRKFENNNIWYEVYDIKDWKFIEIESYLWTFKKEIDQTNLKFIDKSNNISFDKKNFVNFIYEMQKLIDKYSIILKSN